MHVVKSSSAELAAVCSSTRTKLPEPPPPAPEETAAFITQIGATAMVPVKTAWISKLSPEAHVNEWVRSVQVVAGFVTVHVTLCPLPFFRHVKTTTLFTAIVVPSAALRFAPNPGQIVPALPCTVCTLASVADAKLPPPIEK